MILGTIFQAEARTGFGRFELGEGGGEESTKNGHTDDLLRG